MRFKGEKVLTPFYLPSSEFACISGSQSQREHLAPFLSLHLGAHELFKEYWLHARPRSVLTGHTQQCFTSPRNTDKQTSGRSDNPLLRFHSMQRGAHGTFVWILSTAMTGQYVSSYRVCSGCDNGWVTIHVSSLQ